MLDKETTGIDPFEFQDNRTLNIASPNYRQVKLDQN